MNNITDNTIPNILKLIYNVNFKYTVHYNIDNDNKLCKLSIMGPDGISFCNIWINTENENVFIDNISILPNIKDKNLTKELIYITELIGSEINAKYSYITVKSKSWMNKWCKKNGYYNPTTPIIINDDYNILIKKLSN